MATKRLRNLVSRRAFRLRLAAQLVQKIALPLVLVRVIGPQRMAERAVLQLSGFPRERFVTT